MYGTVYPKWNIRNFQKHCSLFKISSAVTGCGVVVPPTWPACLCFVMRTNEMYTAQLLTWLLRSMCLICFSITFADCKYDYMSVLRTALGLNAAWQHLLFFRQKWSYILLIVECSRWSLYRVCNFSRISCCPAVQGIVYIFRTYSISFYVRVISGYWYSKTKRIWYR